MTPCLRLRRATAAVSILLLGSPLGASACTTIAVGKRATLDGSVLASHSNDGEGDTDPRLVLVPAADWPEGASRPVFYSPESFPRYVGPDRSAAPVPAYSVESIAAYYDPGVGDAGDGPGGPGPFRPLCHIPQVPHTYQYFEQTYGAMNERQLGIAESTCSGVFGASPRGVDHDGDGAEHEAGGACLSVDALTQIAMERHHRARDAVREMGALAEEHGFYGAGAFEGTAESLIVTDAEEAWVFHILPDPAGISAIWAAQRVPDDGYAVVANVFVIREIDVDDTENFMYSRSVHAVARELGWWDPTAGKLLDFTALYSDGEYAHKYYSGRRTWGVHQRFAPSLGLDPEYEEWRISRPYPFSAKPDKKVGVEDVALAMRSHYEDTPFSRAGESSGLNLAGGPFRSPEHVAGGEGSGNWERTIGLFRTSDSYIAQSRDWLPDRAGGVLWWAPYAAPYSAYVPFACGMAELPRSTLGTHMRLDKGTLFWAFRYLGNYAQWNYEAMIREVNAFQNRMMRSSLDLQATVDEQVLGEEGREDDAGESHPSLLATYATNAGQILDRTWQLNDHLMFKYADGQIHNTLGEMDAFARPREMDSLGHSVNRANIKDHPGYRDEWLDAVGFRDGPPPPPACEDLGWRCGHEPAPGDFVDGTLLRGGNARHAAHYWEYQARRARASSSGKSTCGLVGDAAAMLGKCSRSDDEGAKEASRMPLSNK